MQNSELVAVTFKVLGDRRACELLAASADGEGVDPSTAMKKRALTRKQFYTRLARLKKLKLIKKSRGGNYVPTLQGRLIINILIPLMAEIVENRWKIDSVDKLMADKEIPVDHIQGITDSLLRSSSLKEPIMKILGESQQPPEPSSGGAQNYA